LLAGFRQNINADAVFLISDRGRVLARAGDLYDSSMEVSLLSALVAIYGAGLKISRFIRQERPENYHVFRGGDHDLILIPVDSSHALLLAGKDLARADRILQTIEGMLSVRSDVENILQSLGVAPITMAMESILPEPEAIPQSDQPEPEVDLDALFASADEKSKVKDIDAFWNDAVEKTTNIPTNPDVITYDEARKLGLTPGKGTGDLHVTGPLKFIGPFKKK